MNFKVIKNHKFNGIELYFEEKPNRKTLDYLKANGFRWHNKKKCWYAKEQESTVEAVENLKKGILPDTTASIKPENIHGVKVGDIFWMCWGYGQTNNDFFQVIELRGKHMVKIREIRTERVPGKSAGLSSYVKPVKDAFVTASNIIDKSDGVYKKVQKSGEHIYLSMTSFGNAVLVKDLNREYYESWGY